MGYERLDPRNRQGNDPSRFGEQDRHRPNRFGESGRREDRSAPRDYGYEDRGFIDRAGDEVRSWFGDEEAERRRRWDEREYERRYGRPAAGGYDDAYSSESRGGYGRGGSGYGAYGGGGFGAPTAYAPYAGGIYQESSRLDHDPRYRDWRDRQIQSLDRDYEEYRREHQSQFEQDFATWRETREGQRRSLRTVREQQEVVGSDGSRFGTVDKVRGDRIILTTGDQGSSSQHSIPCSWVARVDEKVELNCTADQARAKWKENENRGAGIGDDQSEGPHILNRSFSGTY